MRAVNTGTSLSYEPVDMTAVSDHASLVQSAIASAAAPPQQMTRGYAQTKDPEQQPIGAPRYTMADYPQQEPIGAEMTTREIAQFAWNSMQGVVLILTFCMALAALVIAVLCWQKNIQQQKTIHALKVCCNLTMSMSSSLEGFSSTLGSHTSALGVLQAGLAGLASDVTVLTTSCANATDLASANDAVILALEQCCVDNAQSISALVPTCSACP